MSEKEKAEILKQAANLPPLLKARAEGFMQGLTAASAGATEQTEKTEKKEEPADD